MENNSAQKRSEPDRKRGLNSPFGSVGSILAHFHWTYEYLLWGIPWITVQLMLADMPRYDYDKKEETKAVPLTTENADDFKNYIKSIS